MKKKLLTILLSIAVILTSTVTVFADDNQVLIVGGSSFSTVQAAVDAAENNQTIKLNGNCKENVNIPAEKTVTIDLNSNVLTGAGTGSVITVLGNLTLTDSSSAKTGKVTGGKATGGNGGGVYVGCGSFEMTGGTITGNEAGHGGGIFVTSGAQTNITNGIIENNHTTASGAGVQVDGNFTMTGGTIKNNKADGDGGGLSINGNTGMATLAGTTEIINNTANGKGGGVSYYGNNSGKVVLGGKVKIVGNVENGTINEGTLTGVTANNVYLFYDNLYVAIGTDIYAPMDGMLVGITTCTAPAEETPVKFTTNGTANNVEYFTSDDANYKIQHNNTNDYLELANITIEDVLATVPGDFPTTSESGWVNGNGAKVWIEDDCIEFAIKINLNSVLTKDDNNNYKYGNNYTFVMDSGVLSSIKVEEAIFLPPTKDPNGVYVPYKYTNDPISIPAGYTGDITFITNGKYADQASTPVTVSIDDVLLDDDLYEVTTGSIDTVSFTNVIIKESYVSRLTVGTHTIKIGMDGYVDISTQFTITSPESTPEPDPDPTPDPTPSYKVPNTGVEGTPNNHSLLKFSSLSILAVGTYIVIKKKKDND